MSHPGETLLETIELLGISEVDETIDGVIKGEKIIDLEIALKLERMTNVPARFWLNRERNYRERKRKENEN